VTRLITEVKESLGGILELFGLPDRNAGRIVDDMVAAACGQDIPATLTICANHLRAKELRLDHNLLTASVKTDFNMKATGEFSKRHIS